MAIMWIGIGVSLLCFVLMLFGGKIYNMLQAVMTFKVIWVLRLPAASIGLLPGRLERVEALLRGFFWPFNGDCGLAIPPD